MSATRATPPRGASPTVRTTAYGPRALDTLRRSISDLKGTDALAPVTVVVPNNLVGVAARRALASGHHGAAVSGRSGLAGTNFVTVDSLAQQLGGQVLAVHGKRPTSQTVIAAAVRGVLEHDAGLFAPVADHPATERRLVAAHHELAQLSESQLQSLARTSERARDLTQIHRLVSARLRHRWYQQHELLWVAQRAVETNQADLAPIGALVVYLPQDISLHQARLLLAVARSLPMSIIVGLTGVDSADATVAASLHLLHVESPGGPPGPAVLPAVEMTNTSDPDEEVRAVVRGIIEAARSGVFFDRMAVLHPRGGPYPRLLQDHLDAAGVPRNAPAVGTLAQTVAGRTLRRLLRLAERGYRREDVAALLAGSPVQWDGRPVPSRAWEQISRDAGIVKGVTDWHEKLEVFARELAGQSKRLTTEPHEEWRARRITDRLRLTASLQAFMVELEVALDRGRDLTGWAARSSWCRGLLHWFLGDQRSWPAEQRRASEQIETTLDGLARLESFEPDVAHATFDRTLDAQLQLRAAPPGSPGNGVLVGQIGLSVGLDADHVWIVGMVEGSLPGAPRHDSLLPEHERVTGSGLEPLARSIDDEHRYFLAALAAVGSHGVAHLMRPRGDLRRSGERAPSRWLLDLAVELSGQPLRPADLDHLPEPWSHHVASFAGGVLRSGFPATTQEFALRALVDELEAEGHIGERTLERLGPSLAAGAALQEARSGHTFTRFDGNLSALSPRRPAGAALQTSATALETYARCPHQYLMRYLLKVSPLELPEYRLRVDASTRGNIVHRVLERFVSERGIDRNPQGTLSWSGQDSHQLRRLAEAEFRIAQEQGLTGEPLFWRRDRVLIMRDLEAFLNTDNERRAEHQLRPIATELTFGLGDAPAVEIALPDGFGISISGSIDLVDQDAAGNLTVVDYKTGRASSLNPDKPHGEGRRLQLVLYALAARVVLGRPEADVTSIYWHINARERYRTVGYRVTPRISDITLRAVATVAAGISVGLFPQHPRPSAYSGMTECAYCDPDAMGTSDARRRLLLKAGQPELEAYFLLTEPGVLQ